MFAQLFNRVSTAEFHLASPLAEPRLRYLNHCGEQGAARRTLRRIAQYLLVIISQLDLEADREVRVEEIQAAAQRWACREPRHHKTKDPETAKTRFISIATQWLRFLGRLQVLKAPPNPGAQEVEEIAAYLDQEKGLSAQTIQTECFYVREFLNRFCAPPRQLHEISIPNVDEALPQKGRQDGYTRGAIRFYAAALRAFFRYAEMRGWCTPGLAASILAPHVYRDELLPLGPSWEDVQRLLATTGNDRPIDVRDRAIIMFLAVYGLRSAEVRSLRLEDLDWEKELILVSRSKQRRTQLYPLSQVVGEAIVRYLKEVRPRSVHREIFLTLQSPIRPLSPSGLWHVVGDRLRTLGVSMKHFGPHSLRHACATHLLTQHFSMKEISDHLGHRSPDATRTYAKVDIAGLREVADFQLGGLL